MKLWFKLSLGIWLFVQLLFILLFVFYKIPVIVMLVPIWGTIGILGILALIFFFLLGLNKI